MKKFLVIAATNKFFRFGWNELDTPTNLDVQRSKMETDVGNERLTFPCSVFIFNTSFVDKSTTPMIPASVLKETCVLFPFNPILLGNVRATAKETIWVLLRSPGRLLL